MPLMQTQKFEVGELKGADDGHGVDISGGAGVVISLVFNGKTSHKEIDELARQLENLKLTEVVIHTP